MPRKEMFLRLYINGPEIMQKRLGCKVPLKIEPF